MENIHLVAKEVSQTLKILSACFDENEAITKSGNLVEDFKDGYMDILESGIYGRLILLEIPAQPYEEVLKTEDIESILEYTNKIEAMDYLEDAYEVTIMNVINSLPDGEEKQEWIVKLGLDNSNDYEEDFDIDSMITNK
jgi:hypothetical protein